MPELQTKTQIKKAASLSSYASLLGEVRKTLALGHKRAKEAVEREKVRTSWGIGKLIHEHILLHKERAKYGEQVLKRLSDDLRISLTEIRYMTEFARTYPIHPPAGELSWAHYRELLAINDNEGRKTVAKKAAQEKWTRGTLRREIGKLKVKNPKALSASLAEELLTPLKGKLNTYRIVPDIEPSSGRLYIDLGFANYLELSEKYRKVFHAGEVVLSKGTKNGYSLHPSQSTLHDVPVRDAKISTGRTQATGSECLFTYQVRVLDITDGDTFWAVVDLGFGVFTKQHLRLRGLDAPEAVTRDGQEARKFLERELKGTSQIVITSTKSDKYDRYLVDVFYVKKNREEFLNNRLLQAGLAVTVRS